VFLPSGVSARRPDPRPNGMLCRTPCVCLKARIGGGPRKCRKLRADNASEAAVQLCFNPAAIRAHFWQATGAAQRSSVGTSLNLLEASCRSIARSAETIAEDLIAAWPAAVWFSSKPPISIVVRRAGPEPPPCVQAPAQPSRPRKVRTGVVFRVMYKPAAKNQCFSLRTADGIKP